MSETRPRVLFLCAGNSCRSQMAEGWARFLSKGRVDAFSAGTEPKPVHPLAVRVLHEVGIDISGQQSKAMEIYLGQPFDFIITVCDRAKERCPVWPGIKERIHWSFDDPAEATGTEEERLRVFARVRDEIRTRVRLFLTAHKIDA
jgi:arsenate reductase (thioredoxin)